MPEPRHIRMYLCGICGERRPRSDCAEAQSDQGIRCPPRPIETLDVVQCIDVGMVLIELFDFAGLPESTVPMP